MNWIEIAYESMESRMDLSQWSELVAEWDYYRAHQDELVELYSGKVVVLHAKQVAAAFDTSSDALDFGIQRFGIGKFLIQPCSPGDKDLLIKHLSGRMVSR